MPDTNETALEKTFSDLAYSHLRDKSQGLLDYLVGFQMLKQEDDGKRAVGIFGFEIDEDFYYAPIFFLNGEIRGLESLYSPKSDLFVPLTDEWVNTVINRRQLSLGSTDTRSRSQRGVHVPNYTRLKVIPGGTGSINLKLGSGEDIGMGQMREFPAHLSFPDALAQTGLTAHFKEALARNPRLKQAVDQFYSAIDFYDAPEQKVAAAEEEAVIVINTISDEGTEELTDTQREEMMSGGTIVIDKRPEVAKSQLYSTETKRVLENPTEGGLYDVLWSDGSVTPALVASTNSGCNQVVVYCPDREDRYCTIQDTCVWTVRRYTREEFLDWLKPKSKEATEIRPGQVAFFVSDTGEATEPVCIEEVTTGVDGIVVAKTHKSWNEAVTSHEVYRDGARGENGNGVHNLFMDLRIGGNGDNEFPPFSQRPGNPYDRICQLLVTELGNTVPKFTQRAMVINNKRFRAIVVNTFRMEKPEHDRAGNATRKEEIYAEPKYNELLRASDFGDYNTLAIGIDKLASDLKVWKTGSEVHIKCASEVPFSSRDEGALLRYLVRDIGFGESDARFLLKEASGTPQKFKARISSKVAAELLSMPEMQDTDLGGFLTSFHQQQIPFQNVSKARSTHNREFYQYNSPFGSGDPEASDDTFGVVEDAARTGQKEVFDAAALASLIKSHNPTDMIERFMPTLTSAMDRLGRMMFLIYWHYQDFEDRYGDNDLAEFIDNLKSVFEQLGDVIVFAKKRTLAGDPEHYGLGATPVMDEAS